MLWVQAVVPLFDLQGWRRQKVTGLEKEPRMGMCSGQRTTFLFMAFICAVFFVPMAESRSIDINRNIPNTYCIGNPIMNPNRLQADINALCRVVDCSSIRPGGSCYNPNTVIEHASVVFNLYYRMHAKQRSSCNFGGDAMLTVSNPSHGTCIYT